jgi:hypothetical protein
MWNPVLELHQPLRFCKPQPELLGQRDLKLKCGQRKISARVAINYFRLIQVATMAG